MTTPDAYSLLTQSSLKTENKKIHATYEERKGNRGRPTSEKKTGRFNITYTLTNAAWIPDNSTTHDSHIMNYN